jgi:hypothetical protein
MSDNVRLAAKGIAAAGISALFAICLLIYCYQRGAGQQWGTPIIIAVTFLNMAIMAVTLTVMSRNKRAK